MCIQSIGLVAFGLGLEAVAWHRFKQVPQNDEMESARSRAIFLMLAAVGALVSGGAFCECLRGKVSRGYAGVIMFALLLAVRERFSRLLRAIDYPKNSC